ncbi:hypothetical protein GOEFS_093_00130 [Gordonia effusa NBRC 100432]|uniref:Phenylacetate-CoA ligase n=1 Tax=Gordonia effusa NBRC 100432 TaxID=1077974 RepID=H0R3N3_9ACTN|nr:hypothetical protein [Gordonia effusa]GAB19684.1 hypothetical protein GOEFS_093_00130 [Gordonia effusa NBRC 100432]
MSPSFAVVGSGGIDHAIAIADRAIRNVPAYAAHIRAASPSCGSVRTVDDFRSLPPMTKSNYLAVHPRTHMLWHSDAASAGIWTTSSGSTGVCTYFPGDDVATNDGAGFFDSIFTANFGSRSRTTLVINAFAMGTWIGGTYTLLGLLELRRRGHRLSLITPGMNIDTILTALTDLAPCYDQVVIAGYPPFIKDTLDAAPSHLLTNDIKILLAGEAITETWRDHLLAKLGKPQEPERICLMYGTADAGVIAFETPVTTAVRRAADSDSTLRNALFGDTTILPTFTEVDPMLRFVEVDDDGYLLFTIDAALPLIRYRINDRGAVHSGARLREIVAAHGDGELSQHIDSSAVFLSLTGRPDVAATFYSLNIYDGNLRAAFEHPAMSSALTGKFVIDTGVDHEQNQTLRIHAELSAQTRPDDGLCRDLTALCLEALRDTNAEYHELHRTRGQSAVPVIELHGFGTHHFERTGPKHKSTIRTGGE